MVELLRYLEAHGFTTLITSGGDRDFMRPVTQEIYGIPPERVVGSSSRLRYREDEHGGSLVYQAQPDVFDDSPAKPVRIWSRVRRWPIVAVGNSNGDLPMLHFALGRPGPRCACCYCTTTPRASSTTPRGRNARWSWRKRGGGR